MLNAKHPFLPHLGPKEPEKLGLLASFNRFNRLHLVIRPIDQDLVRVFILCGQFEGRPDDFP